MSYFKNQPTVASVVAKQDSDVWEIPRDVFTKFLEKYPKIKEKALQIMEKREKINKEKMKFKPNSNFDDEIDIVIERLEKEDEYKEAVNELFRIFHSLKSATAFLKLTRINVFAKLVEDVLESARNKDKPTEEFVDWMFLASGQIAKWYEEITHNKELSPIDGRVLKLPKGY